MVNWKGLPVEILLHIFQQTEKKDQCNIVRVCKAWMHPAQTRLYLNISIDNFAQLQKFYNAVKHNNHLGKKVKVFKITIFTHPIQTGARTAARIETFDILTTLLSSYLPNLVQIGGNTLLCYLPVLHALLDSQLKNLKILEAPRRLRHEAGEISNYVTCTLLMKHRLENIFLSDNFNYTDGSSNEQLYFNRLYDRLDQFNKILEVDIHKKSTEEIQELEYTMRNCKLLKKIKCDFRPRNNNETNLILNSSISINAIYDFTPAPNVESLDTHLILSNDYKNLLYIMHKFPGLRKITLSIEGRRPVKLNQNVLTQLLNYFSKIGAVHASDITADCDVITESIESLWKATSKPGKEDVELDYCTHQSNTKLDLFILKGRNKNETEIAYPSPDPEWKHKGFIERNGKFLKNMRLSFTKDGDEVNRSVIAEDCFAHILRHCPNLRTLTFEKWTFEQPSTRLETDTIKTTSLFALIFNHCTIDRSVLQKMTLYLPELYRLSLTEVKSVDWEELENEDDGTEIFHVDMPNTKITTIMLDYDCSEEGPVYVQLHTNNGICYYRYDQSKFDCRKELTSEEYANVGGHRYISVRCATEPIIEFVLNESYETEDLSVL